MIIFLAFVSVAVLVNAMMILLTYRAFATMTTKVSDSLRQMGRSAQTRDWLTAMQTASVRAVDLTQSARQRLELSGPRLEELHSTLGYGLAKIDVRFERFCDLVHKEARNAQMAITGPTQRVGAAATGFLEVLSVMGYGGSADDASSRRKQ
jgi:hypothetical protein